MKNKSFYFGYGMNTNRSGMARRCPAAVSVGAAALYDYDFRFATHADVVPRSGHKTVGVLWEVTDECMKSLDRLESCYFDKNGNPDPNSYYNRKLVKVLHRNQWYDAWVYYMTPGISESPPGDSYWNCLLEGYQEHDVSSRQLHRAIKSAYDSIEPLTTQYEYDRWSYRSGGSEVWHNQSFAN